MSQSVAAPARPGRPATQSLDAAAEGTYKWWVLITAIFGVFVSILDSTIVNTAIPKIEAVFGADLHQGSYIATGYTLAAGVVVGASGYLASRFGIKRIYLGSLALFTIGSALCGLAWDINSLIFFRILQGAGGAALFPLSLSLIFSVFPPDQRGAANGLFGIPVLVAPAIGPTLGGYIVQFIDWRWIFYVNVPIGIAGVAIGWRVLRDSPPQTGLRFDVRGFALIAAGLFLLLYGLSNLAYDGWSSIITVSGPTIIALVLLAVFIVVEWRTTQPLLDLHLFTNRNFWAGNLIIWVATVGLFGGAFFLPQYLQNLRGLDPFHSGLQVLPQGLAAIVATVLSGVLYNRVGPRALMIGGALVLVIDTYFIAGWATLTSAFAALTPLLIVRGLCLPPLAQTSNTVALQGVRGSALPGASTLVVVARQVVASLAVAVLGNELTSQRILHNAHLAGAVTMANPVVSAAYQGLVASGVARGLPLQQAQGLAISQLEGRVAQQATALAFQDVFYLSALVAIPAIVLPFLLKGLRTAPARVAPAPPGSTPVASGRSARPAIEPSH